MQSINKNKDIQTRIFPIVLEDAKIYDPLTRQTTIYSGKMKRLHPEKIQRDWRQIHNGELLGDLNNYDDFRHNRWDYQNAFQYEYTNACYA